MDAVFWLAVAALLFTFTPQFKAICDRVCPYDLIIQHDEIRGWQVFLERRP